MIKKIVGFISCMMSVMILLAYTSLTYADVLLNRSYMIRSGLENEGIKATHSVTVVDNQFYAYLDDETLRVIRDDNEAELFCELPTLPYGMLSTFSEEELDEIVTHIATDGENLYGWDIYTGCFGLIDTAGIHWQKTRLPIDELHPWNDENTLRIVRNYVNDGELYVFASLAEYQDEPGLLMIQFDLSHGFVKTLEIPDAISVCKGNDSEYYALCVEDKYGWSIKEIETETKIQTQVSVDLSAFGEEDSLYGFTFSGKDDRFLFSCKGSVYSLGRDKGPEIIGAINTGNCAYDSEAWLLSDDRYALCCTNGINIVSINKQVSEQLKLTIRGRSSLKVDDMYQDRFQNTILVSDYNDVSAAELMTKLLTGDSLTDVFIISVDSNYNTLRTNGFLKPFASDSFIHKELNKLAPNIAEVITDQNGQMVAYPASLSIRTFGVHPGYWRMVFGDLPYPTTIGELLDDWILYEEELAEEYPNLEMWFGFDEYTLMKDFVMNYLQTHDHPMESIASGNALKEALEKLQTIAAIRKEHHRCMKEWEPEDEEGNGVILSLFGERDAMRNNDPGFYVDTQENMVYGMSIFEDETISLIWGDGDQNETNGNMSVYIINPYTEHMDEAEKYLECAAEFEADPYLYYAIHPDCNEPYEYPGFDEKIADTERKIEAIEKILSSDDLEPDERFDIEAMLTYYQRTIQEHDRVKWQIAAETIAMDRQLLNNLNLQLDNECLTAMMGMDEIDQLCKQYIQINMTPEDFLRLLSGKLTMIEAEKQ